MPDTLLDGRRIECRIGAWQSTRSTIDASRRQRSPPRRMDEAGVFDSTHQLIFELVERG
jgi:hypothetical protein